MCNDSSRGDDRKGKPRVGRCFGDTIRSRESGGRWGTGETREDARRVVFPDQSRHRLQESTAITEAKAAHARAVGCEDPRAIVASGHLLFNLSPTLGVAQKILNTVPLELPGRAGLRRKVAFLRSYTVEPAIPLLRAMARLEGIELTVKMGEFNSYAQEVLDPQGWLYRFDPDLIFLACQTRDLAPNLWSGLDEASAADSDSVVTGIVTRIVSLIDQLRLRKLCYLLW